MSRARLIRPAFFKHGDLFAAECEAGLPLRLAFAGLWTVTDKEGRFRWTRDLKPDILPYDDIDMLAVLDALEQHGFVKSYVVDGKRYGLIPSFNEHQTFHKTERPSVLPAPPLDRDCATVPPLDNGEPTVTYTSVTGAVAVAGTGAVTGTAKDPTPTTTAAANDEAELAGMLETDADRNALTRVLLRSRSRVATLAAIRSMLTGNDPAMRPTPTPSEMGEALRDLDTNAEVFAAGRFRGYIGKVRMRRANDGRAPPGAGGTKTPTQPRSAKPPSAYAKGFSR